MRSRCTSLVLFVLGSASCLAPATSAQGSASSRSWFLEASDTGPGAVAMQSANWRLDAGFGSGVSPARSASGSWSLTGSWHGLLGSPASGAPWLSAAIPSFAPLGGQSSHSCVGQRSSSARSRARSEPCQRP